MRGLLNDGLRFFVARSISIAGVLLDCWQRLRIRRYYRTQRRLRRKYRIAVDTPVRSYGPRVVESMRHAFVRSGRDARFALTSASTGEPKKILYTRRRLLALKFAFSDMFARACQSYGFKRTVLYVFSSFQPDASLTTMLLDEHKL